MRQGESLLQEENRATALGCSSFSLQRQTCKYTHTDTHTFIDSRKKSREIITLECVSCNSCFILGWQQGRGVGGAARGAKLFYLFA